MELKGNLIESIVIKNELFKTKGLRNVFIKNLGSNDATIGLFTLKPYEETTFSTDNVTIETEDLNINFNTDVSEDSKLYIRAIKVIGCVCRD